MKHDICAIGEILVDMSPYGCDADGDSVFAAKAGGAPLNLLATAAKFGASTAFIGKVGDDVFGRGLANTVKTCGIDDRGLVIDREHNTTLAVVSLDCSGERDFSFYRRHGADIFLSTDDIDENIINSCRIFHFGSLSLTSEPARSATLHALNLAKKAGCIVSFDPNYRAPLWDSPDAAVKEMTAHLDAVDIIKLSKDELELIGCTADELIGRGISIVIVSDGKCGADVFTKEGVAHVDARPSNTVDTTGAGDILFGSFLAAFLADGGNLRDITLEKAEKYLRVAAEAAGISTEKKGAIASIPEKSVFDRAMAKYVSGR